MKLAVVIACAIVLIATSGGVCAVMRFGGGDFKFNGP